MNIGMGDTRTPKLRVHFGMGGYPNSELRDTRIRDTQTLRDTEISLFGSTFGCPLGVKSEISFLSNEISLLVGLIRGEK